MSLYSDGVSQLLEVLPPQVRKRLEEANDFENLIEVVLDYGRPAEARYRDRVVRMPELPVTFDDIDYVDRLTGEFGTDNRAGIERTLHRISAIRNRHGRVIGLTCRVGRALEGTIDMIDDIVRSGQSILLLGKPGVGKTTKLREVARVLSDEVERRVVIVDTSNEIAGDGDVPHPGIGSARRMQVRVASEQHNVMIEAVENHMPEVIVIDEIGTEQEASAARTIAERGVQLVGTAHGQTLENLMLNPTLCDLIGGIQAVTLSDAEAARRGTQKTVLERKAPPTFDVVIELLDYDRLAVHHNVQKTVDLILRGVPPRPEIRVRTGAGETEIVQKEQTSELDDPGFNRRFPALSRQEPIKQNGARSESRGAAEANGTALAAQHLIRIYPYGIARTRLERAIREKRAPAYVINDLSQADAVMAIRSTYQSKPRKLRDIAGKPINTVVVKSNTFSQISDALDSIIKQQTEGFDTETRAVEEAQAGIETVMQSNKPFELSPQPAPIRKVQHQMIEARRLASESVGEDPNRRLRILPTRL
ncbi:MAG TPA: R3H domain-containing nucleic acid-binding protein [Fimbriimonadaceae bacterium]|nr:R3H domain-containing nucleic acid-binding protein [Fimbriimonadaceae bacterium]